MTREELKLVSDLTEALRQLHDFQNGPPLYKYKHQWEHAMAMAKDVLPRAEKFLELTKEQT